MGALESSLRELETNVMSSIGGAVADALTVPDALQSAAVLALESGPFGRSATVDEPLAALTELRVLEHALYALLPRAAEKTYSTNPQSRGELRWLMLRAPHEFSAPEVDGTRRLGARFAIVRTAEARWLSLDCAASVSFVFFLVRA